MHDDHGSSAAGVMLSFMVGALTGAALAILFAPRSGRETRELLGEKLREGADQGREVRDRVVAKGRRMVEEAEEFVDRQKDAVRGGRDRLAAAIDAGREAYRSEKEKS